MADSKRELNVPKPARGRNVAGFDAEPPKTAAPAKRSRTPATPPKRRRTKQTTRSRVDDMTMVRVHTSVSVEVATELRERTENADETQTEVLADSLVAHGDTLAEEYDADGYSEYEALGFKRKRSAPRRGRMNVTFYMSKLARTSLDDAGDRAGFTSRSAFVDALLRRHLGLPD